MSIVRNAAIVGMTMVLAAGALQAAGPQTADAAAAQSLALKGFEKDYATAQSMARSGHKLLYMHFTTTWCGWCRKLENDVYAIDQGRKALDGFVCASLDCTIEGTSPSPAGKANRDLMKRFLVRGYPSIVVMAPDGGVVQSWSGYCTPEQFTQRLDKARSNWTEYKAFLAEAGKLDRSNYDAVFKAMYGYMKYQRWDLAADLAGAVRKLDPGDRKGGAAQAAYVQFKAASVLGDAPAKMAAALEDVKRADAQNAKGILESTMCEAAGNLAAVGKQVEAIAMLNDLLAKGVKLKCEQQIYLNIGMYQEQCKDTKAALTSYEKAVAAGPDSPMAASITKYMEKLKGKAQTASR